MAFIDADVTIRPGENGGPAIVVLDDSYKDAQGNQYARAGTLSTGFNSGYFSRQNAFDDEVTPDGGTAQPLDRQAQLANTRKYHAIVEAVKAARGVSVDNKGIIAGAVLHAIGRTAAGNSDANRTAKPAPIAVLAVKDDDDPAIPHTYLGKTGQTLGFGTIKVLT